MEGESVTVIGIAKNGKEGALVQTADGPYSIDGLQAWDDAQLNRQVEVIGRLAIENISEEDLKTDEGEWKAGTPGERKILVEASWNFK